MAWVLCHPIEVLCQGEYVNVKDYSNGGTIHVYDGMIRLEYLDDIGKDSSLELSIYDWKSEYLKGLTFDKQLGNNRYSFSLTDLGIASTPNTLFRFEFKDENLLFYRWNVLTVDKPADNKPLVDIKVKPLNVACGATGKLNLTEFYGIVSGGRAPFVANWYVLDAQGKTTLYQPLQEVLYKNESAMVRIDANPDYNVMLLVTDACGNFDRKVLQIKCNASEKKLHTMFVEPVFSPVTVSPDDSKK